MSDVIYAIGDIHGRMDLLDRAENILAIISKRVPANQPTVRLMGDYIDHGPNSKDVMDKILTSSLAGMPMNCMLGNHDMWLSRIISMVRGNNPSCCAWLNDSTLATIKSYGIAVDSVPKNQEDKMRLLTKFARVVPDEHITYIQNYMSQLSIDAGAIFVHAGLDKHRDINSQSINTCINGPDIKGGFPASGWEDDIPVVMGHIVKPSPLISANGKIIDIDTGAYESGILTCAIITGGHPAAFLAITPKGGINFVPVIQDDPNVPLSHIKLMAKWWKDVIASSREPVILVFASKEREEFFVKATGIQRYKIASSINPYRKEGYKVMPVVSR